METKQRLELKDWQEVIDTAIRHGYRGPKNLLNNRAKAWSFAYLESKGFEVILLPRKPNTL